MPSNCVGVSHTYSEASVTPIAPLISMRSVSKAFGDTAALKSVSFELLPGTVHALMGENGAGKSTLMKILAGVIQPDTGLIMKDGHAVQFASPREALDAGVSTVFQELSLLPNLTVAENLFLGKEPLTAMGRIDRRLMERQTREVLGKLDLNIPPGKLVGSLSIAERQFVEIARGISAAANVIILDEPTAALNAADVEVLNRQIRLLRDQGKSIVYISHRMEEIFRTCDTVTVLKDGCLVRSVAVSSVTPKALIAMMVGRDIAELFPLRPKKVSDEVVLSIEGLTVAPGAKTISLKLHKREIVGLAGLEGQGQRDLVRALIGRHAVLSGTVEIKGRRLSLPLSANAGVRMLQFLGLGFVPEDRKDEGLFLDLSVAHNIDIGVQSRRSELQLARRCRDLIASTIESMAIKVGKPSTAVGTLSGGNQQKALLGRYLALGADILVIEEPTRGVDVGAKADMYRLLRDFASRGGAILVLSREMLELIGLCDHLYIVHDKAIVGDMPAEDATEHNILEAALYC